MGTINERIASNALALIGEAHLKVKEMGGAAEVVKVLGEIAKKKHNNIDKRIAANALALLSRVSIKTDIATQVVEVKTTLEAVVREPAKEPEGKNVQGKGPAKTKVKATKKVAKASKKTTS